MEVYNVIGIMSGTSLDGLDICYSKFQLQSRWSFDIKTAETVSLPQELKSKLKNAISLSGLELSLLNNSVGDFIGESINEFLLNHNINKNEINFISSHGHTIFHQPKKQLTLQIGNGANISALTQLPVVCDFRTTDLALNGNGAPLVPIGDQLLFSEYDYCINLGGISNISYQEDNNRVAFDICPVNMILNYLSNQLGSDYDKNGEFAKSGQVSIQLYEQLNQLEYYHLSPPKSLGYECVETNIIPLLKSSNLSNKDLLRTFVEHIAFQISRHLTNNGKAIFTGGGTHNTFLIERIRHLSKTELIIPNKEIIDFKEALIFGFLGILRWRNEINVLKSVTGSRTNNVGGCIYNPFSIS
jgi:anhydro-N-acetylmuramic acid kinase